MTRSCSRRDFLTLAAGAAGLGLAGCSSGAGLSGSSGSGEAAGGSSGEAEVDLGEFASLAIDMNNWSYDEGHDVYWQVGITYCCDPVSELYETLAIYVPGRYFEATAHGRFYTCTVSRGVRVGRFTSTGAPLVIPINSVDFATQDATMSYYYTDELGEFLNQGMIVVYPGLRGRSSSYDSATDTYMPGGAPLGLVDIKAVVRYLRYNDADLPGSANRIVTIGHASGGTLSVLAGATGDAALFDPYLEKIGAATHDAEGEPLSDAVWASVSWCPQLPVEGDAAYEWAVGQFDSSSERKSGSFAAALSGDLAASWADHVEGLELVDDGGGELLLEEGDASASDDANGPVFCSGTYYDAVIGRLERSFSDFATRCSFPFAEDLSAQPSGYFPGASESFYSDAQAASGAVSSQEEASSTTEEDADAGTTYETLDDYIAHLNEDETWLAYDVGTGTTTISDLGSFARVCRPAQVGLGAFDALDRSRSTNQLFGVGQEGESLHFDATMGELIDDNSNDYEDLSGWDEDYPADWDDDLDMVDELEGSMETRCDMYDPFYFLAPGGEGLGSSTPAVHWRINSGVQQDATTLVQEMDLDSCLSGLDGVLTADLTLVWESGFSPAERVGTLVDNLSAWIAGCYLKH